jgi:hypothetical protein
MTQRVGANWEGGVLLPSPKDHTNQHDLSMKGMG